MCTDGALRSRNGVRQEKEWSFSGRGAAATDEALCVQSDALLTEPHTSADVMD